MVLSELLKKYTLTPFMHGSIYLTWKNFVLYSSIPLTTELLINFSLSCYSLTMNYAAEASSSHQIKEKV